MSIVVVLNINPNENQTRKIVDNREYTRKELKNFLNLGLQDIADNIIFYNNFNEFKENVNVHADDFVVNFDFGFKSKMRNMSVPAFCENYQIRYFNPDPYVQVLCQDKYITERYAENFGVRVPKSSLVFSHSNIGNIFKNLEFPIIIKPNYESESIGITQDSIVSTAEEAIELILELQKHFDGLIVEEYIEGREVAITLFGDDDDIFLEEVEVIFPEKMSLRYKAYTSEVKQKIRIDIKKSCYVTNEQRQCLKQLYKSLGANKLIRIDGRIKGNDFYLIEINANPGLYPTSIVPRTFELNGLNYSSMLTKLFKNYL